jgi:branched-chain amino acid transport system ATP-binding protein
MSLLVVKNLQAAYGQVKVLHGLNFELAEGEITTLLGANGAGKTTTIRALCNMVKTSGEVLLEGKNIASLKTDAIVKLKIAHVPQGRGTFTRLSVDENLDLGAMTRTDKADVLADKEKMLSLFPILKKRITQQAGTLSGGEQQMLAVARALALPLLL